MTPGSVDAPAVAVFLVSAFSIAGCAQAMWLSWPGSRHLAWPLDGGATFRGRRIFGPNKTLRGFVVMLPVTGASFMVLAAVSGASGLWPLSVPEYGALGVIGALGFMAGELPNSFLKRQLDIPSGRPAEGRFLRPAFFLADHLDSAVGALLSMALVVPVPLLAVLYVLAIGCLVHVGFSALTFQLGGKERAA